MFRLIIAVLGAAFATTLRRASKGPRLPGWSFGTELIRATQRAALDVLATMNPPAARRIMDAAGARRRNDGRLTASSERIGGVPTTCFESTAESGSGATVLYFHGGGYVLGSAKMLAAFTADIADGICGRVVSVDYRLAPEHPYPAALEDAIAVYRGVVASGVAASRIVVAGDSAGGNLAAALLLALRSAGDVLPAAAVLLCPWVDLANQGDSFRRNDATDTLSFEAAEIWSAMVRGEQSAKDPSISPLQANLAGLPPLLVIAGEAEVLIDPIEAFAERARDAGVDVEFEVVPEMFHDWMMVASVPQSKPTLDRVCTFVVARAGESR